MGRHGTELSLAFEDSGAEVTREQSSVAPMLHQLQWKWSKLLRLRQANRELPVLRWQVERLEDRSMLNASYVQVPHGHGPDPMRGPPGASKQQSMRPGAYAPPPSYRDVSAFHPMGVDHGLQPASDGFQTERRMEDDLAARSMLPAHDSQWSPYLNPNPSGPISPPAAEKLGSPIINTQTRTNTPNTSLGSVGNPVLPHSDVPAINPLTLSNWTASLPPGTWNVYLVSPYSYTFIETVKVGSQSLSDPHYVANPNQSTPGIVGSVAPKTLSGTAPTDLPVLSQLYLHDSSSYPASVVSAALRDIVFQGYLPNAAAIANSINYDRTNVNALTQESGSPLPVDGFIEQTDESFADIGAAPGDALTVESNAVNDILRTLHEVEAPAQISLAEPPAVGEPNVSNPPTVTIDLQTDFTIDEVAAVQLDGGMVLLQSTSDANTSSFDLTPMYAAQMASFVAPTSMEASVGEYQAIDVAVDESPIVESLPSGATINASTDIETQSPLPLKTGHDASHKAATVLGVTALTGAMVWMSRARAEADEAQQAAQKRRVISA